MSSRYNSSDSITIRNKKIFFDANILIYLYWATASEWDDKYAKIYDDIDDPSNNFIVDFIVISEFVNRAMRISYDIYLDEKGFDSKDISFKEYRNNQEGQEALQEVYTLVKEVLEYFEVIESSYSKSKIEEMCTSDDLDISDKAIVEICKNNDFILLTNDSDFKDSDVDILSCNNSLVN